MEVESKDRQIKTWTAGRRRLIALNVLVMIIISLAIFGGVNYMANRYYYRQDCTLRRTYALSDKTKNILSQITQPVQIYILVYGGHPVGSRIHDLLEEYKMHSNKITVENLTNEHPTVVKTRLKYLQEELKLVLQENNIIEIIFVCGKRSKVVNARETYTPKYDYQYGYPRESGLESFRGEEAFTGAILSVIQEKMTKLYFTNQHGEPELDDQQPNGIGFLNSLLKGANMETQALDLRKNPIIPSDADVVAITGPTEPFLTPEINALQEYLKKGGKLLVLLGPQAEVKLDGLLKEWGVVFSNDVVLDDECGPLWSLIRDRRVPVVTDYGASPDHPITKDLKQRKIPTDFPLARSLEVAQPPPTDLEIIEIARSSSVSWGETNIEALIKGKGLRYDEKEDKKGPLALAFAIKKQNAQTRLVVLGSADMINNRYLSQNSATYQSNLIMNAIRWLAGQEQFISIEPKKAEDTSINFSGKRPLILLLVSLVFIPLSAVILGLFVWLMRRK